ncbi:uncharacterized protein LOC142525903 [Primulina tabacum]|uniref:uncharacterized protein LOC142525903 n=1 Tax=Primulina tabacum TaxID=48773 RepID=UPI003F5926A5
MQEVVKAETIKLLDAGIIYPISDRAWNLNSVLMRCEETNLVLNWEKCHFMVEEGIVLGHKISEQGIEVDKAKVEVIENLPPSASIKGVRSFLGHAGFTSEYEYLKEYLVTAPVLVAPDWDLPFKVMFASDTTVGVVLGQRQNKRCVAEEEMRSILSHCHDREMPTRGGQVEVSIREIKRILEKVVGINQNDWSLKLDDALWAFRISFKTPIGTTPYMLLFGKSCHLLVKLEHRAYWSTKALNIDFALAGEHMLLQLDKLEEFRGQAYDLALTYKKRTKQALDKRITLREFKEGKAVLLYNSRLRLFPGKLNSRLTGPYIITEVFPSRAINLRYGKNEPLPVNAQQLKHYLGGAVE